MLATRKLPRESWKLQFRAIDDEIRRTIGTPLAEQFKIGDLESPFGELRHFLVQPFIVSHAMIRGNPGIVFLYRQCEQMRESRIVLNGRTKKNDGDSLMFEPINGALETRQISAISSSRYKERVYVMALQIIVKHVVHHEAASLVGAKTLVQRWLAAGGRRLHEIDVGEDGREPVPELSGVAIADQELISLLGILAEAHRRVKD